VPASDTYIEKDSSMILVEIFYPLRWFLIIITHQF
jgi:hypothetical protein